MNLQLAMISIRENMVQMYVQTMHQMNYYNWNPANEKKQIMVLLKNMRWTKMPCYFIQPPSNNPGIPFRNVHSNIDTAGTDHRDEEVRGMNEDHHRDQQEWDREHK